MKRKIAWAVAISLLAFFLRLYLSYYGPIENDEPTYISAAVDYNLDMRQGNWSQIIDSPFNYEHPAFNKLVFAVGLFSSKPILSLGPIRAGQNLQSVPYWPKLLVLRIISSFFGAATVFLLSLIQPLAGLFLAVDTFGIKYTSLIYLEALPGFTSLAAVMIAKKAADAFQNNSGNRWKWIGWLVLSSLAVGMSAASKYLYGVVAIAIIITVLFRMWKQIIPALLGLAGWGLLSLIFFFLLDPAIWRSPIERLTNSVQFNIHFTTSSWVVDANYPFWQPIKWLMLSITQQPYRGGSYYIFNGNYLFQLDPLIFILGLVGLPVYFLKNKPMFIFLIVSLVFLMAWGTKWPQYIVLVLAPFCLSAAYGFISLRSVVLRGIGYIRLKTL